MYTPFSILICHRCAAPGQSEFAATVVDLADVVSGFASFTDTSKLAEVSDSVLAVGERIEMSIQQAKVFNHENGSLEEM